MQAVGYCRADQASTTATQDDQDWRAGLDLVVGEHPQSRMPILGLFTHGLVPSSINRPGVHNINQAADARAPGRAHDATMNQHHAITFPAGVVASFTFSGIDVNSARKVFVLGR